MKVKVHTAQYVMMMMFKFCLNISSFSTHLKLLDITVLGPTKVFLRMFSTRASKRKRLLRASAFSCS